jgi:hypothetical protein
MFQTASSAAFLIVVACTVGAFSDVTVIRSGGPTFPLQVDKVRATVYRNVGEKKDSLTVGLPVSLYAELRDNIDTIFTYADALRKRRRELSENSDHASGGSYVTFEYLGLCVMRIFFSNTGFGSGKLAAAEDRYPFVVILTKGFSKRLKKLIKIGPR